jgi:predicted acetyltransferase
MNHFADAQGPLLEVTPATPEQQPILANLLELYAHDFSELRDLQLGPDGRFGYERLPLYWSEPGRHPFLVSLDGEWAGFVLVQQGSVVSGDAAIWDVAEFFVVRGHRRCGIGTQMAHDIWRRFAGPWEVRVLESNVAASNFWERAISAFTGRVVVPALFKSGDERWKVFAFQSTARS